VPTWIPNAITVLRIALIPAWWFHAHRCAALVASGEDGSVQRSLALGALLLIGASDLADGYLARRYQLITQLGAVLDALADKLAQVLLLVFFTFQPSQAFATVPLSFFAVVIGRDLVLGSGYLLIRERRGRTHVTHHWHGKLASLLIFLLLAALTAGLAPSAALPALHALSVLIVLSTASYFRDGWRQWSAPPR
jgi:cardiolipin synthase